MNLLAVALLAGATFTGYHAAHGPVSFTLSDDGTRVVDYSIRQVAANTCTFEAAGVEGFWEGAPIVNGDFSYSLDTAIELHGHIDGTSATGTFRMRNENSPTAPKCDSGTVPWTAAAPGVKPPPLPASTPVPSATPPAAKPGISLTTITVKRSAGKLSGRLSSPDKTCRAKRRVVLKWGTKQLAKTKSGKDGSFSFRRTSHTRGRTVKISVTRAGTCAAVTSKRLKG